MRAYILSFLFLFSVPAGADFEIPPPYECSPVADSPRVESAPLCLAGGWRSGLDAFCQPLSFTAISRDRAESMFRELVADPAIPFRFLPDGCQARAQRMAEILLARGVRAGKIFVKGRFELPNPFDPLWPVVRWQYHVAIVVRTEEGNIVIDPSLFAAPVSLEQFLDTFRAFPVSRIDEVYLTGPFTYELNHRALLLDGFRARDLECGAELLRTGLVLQGK